MSLLTSLGLDHWLSPPAGRSYRQAWRDFQRCCPEYASTAALDDWRRREFSRLDRQNHTYLDFTGGGLYAESQLREHQHLLQDHVFGNPHSTNPTSQAMTEQVAATRQAVLAYFNADPAEYTVVFTPNASGALKLLGEAYPFGPDSEFLLTADNHNSVNGIREFARHAGAAFTYAPLHPETLRLDEPHLRELLARPAGAGPRLFAFPAQSNFSGVKHPLRWVADAQAAGWDVLLDAAAYVPTNRLDLRTVQPEFVCVSFYKMFGYPTGLGCLLARRPALARLRRPWFAGGTISMASVGADLHRLAQDEEAFEDGTVNYLAIPAIGTGLRTLQQMDLGLIQRRLRLLTGWLLTELQTLHHANGQPLIQLLGPADNEMRGATLALNFYDPHGQRHPYEQVEARANAEQISLRTGCFCNPGAMEAAADLSPLALRRVFALAEHGAMSAAELRAALPDRPIGAVRVSLGPISTFQDAYRFVALARTFLDETAVPVAAAAEAAALV